MGKPYEIILNLGSSHVSASKLISKSEKLFLEQHQLIELPVTNNGEQDWTESVGDAIAEHSSEHGFKGHASLILPGSIVLSKTLRVPKVEVEKQRKVVEFELSQKLPFPIETLQWDFLVNNPQNRIRGRRGGPCANRYRHRKDLSPRQIAVY